MDGILISFHMISIKCLDYLAKSNPTSFGMGKRERILFILMFFQNGKPFEMDCLSESIIVPISPLFITGERWHESDANRR